MSKNIEYIVEMVEKDYDLKVRKINKSITNGYLGDIYCINDTYILKIPKRGGFK